MKTCIKCGQNKNIDNFGFRKSKNKIINTCKECENNRSRQRYKTTSCEYHAKYRLVNKEASRLKDRALKKLNDVKYKQLRKDRYNKLKEQGINYYNDRYIKEPYKSQANLTLKYHIGKKNILRPSSCSLCEKESNIHGHHDSYLKKDRLNVRWLCSSCHSQFHADYKILIILLDIQDVIYPYIENDENINIFYRAVIGYPDKNLNLCLKDIEFNIFKLVFNFLDNFKLDIIKSEYGQLTKDMYGISTIVKNI